MMPVTRSEAIFGIRRAILELVDDDHSMCDVAAKMGIMCNGFRRLSDADLEARYGWLSQRQGKTGRAAVESLANRWQLARQFVSDTSLSCDVQTREHDTCLGWDGFSNEELASYYKTLCGEEIFVVPDTVPSSTGRTP